MENNTIPAQAGLDDEQWYLMLIDRYTPYVTAILSGIAKGALTAADIEEAAADVFFKVWRSRDRIRPEGLKAYVAQTARHTAIDRLRGGVPAFVPYDEDILLVSCPQRPDELAIAREQKQIVEDAVRSFGEPDRELFIRFYYFGERLGAIAGLLHLKPATAKTKLYRLRSRLREIMKERGYDCETETT